MRCFSASLLCLLWEYLFRFLTDNIPPTHPRRRVCRKKYITTVRGLDLFGVKLKKASKLFGRKFAGGSSVVRGEIRVQGDHTFDMSNYILEAFPDEVRRLCVWGGARSTPKSSAGC